MLNSNEVKRLNELKNKLVLEINNNKELHTELCNEIDEYNWFLDDKRVYDYNDIEKVCKGLPAYEIVEAFRYYNMESEYFKWDTNICGYVNCSKADYRDVVSAEKLLDMAIYDKFLFDSIGFDDMGQFYHDNNITMATKEFVELVNKLYE